MLLGYGESAVVRLLVVEDGRRVLRALGGDRPGIVVDADNVTDIRGVAVFRGRKVWGWKVRRCDRRPASVLLARGPSAAPCARCGLLSYACTDTATLPPRRVGANPPKPVSPGRGIPDAARFCASALEPLCRSARRGRVVATLELNANAPCTSGEASPRWFTVLDNDTSPSAPYDAAATPANAEVRLRRAPPLEDRGQPTAAVSIQRAGVGVG